ncbi:acyl carrier protein [Amorphoplanes nipponensis]|uniref:Actinorhodin polyketide synthase acyl carrier protein n=1 Tax=Actinoplanes nipponensis TaxID=135950 RepID=A0A919JDI4_9ACTN|nr:acyl carrier protein [Actinoplanes nipponensis]GIE47370.1 actinorhodin polyketide synthase acyl carrier protein [Actinoplanes nipponensis]
MSQFTIEDLKRIMRACAGEDESVDLDGDIGELTFDQLGYDSLALLETASRVQRELRVALPDEALGDVETPAQFVAFVNGRLLETAA